MATKPAFRRFKIEPRRPGKCFWLEVGAVQGPVLRSLQRAAPLRSRLGTSSRCLPPCFPGARVYTTGMRRHRYILLLLLCLFVPLRTLAASVECIDMHTPPGLGGPMPMAHEGCDGGEHGSVGERAAHCHCVALTGWSPPVLDLTHVGSATVAAHRSSGAPDLHAPRIWRPPADCTASS